MTLGLEVGALSAPAWQFLSGVLNVVQVLLLAWIASRGARRRHADYRKYREIR